MSFPRYPAYKDSGVEWLGEVPAHWEVRRLQRCVNVAEGQVDPEDPTFADLPLIAPNYIDSGTGRLLATETASDQGAESGKYLCLKGDVVYSKIRPALRKVCIAPNESLCSADMYPLRGHSGLTNTFLFWVILSEQFSALAVLESQRVAMPKINREALKSVMLAVPPENEQHAASSFLDNETSKIDALTAEQERLIELLQEKRQSVISHAVTKGLNPDAPMKPSGIDWLGDVPAHWEIAPLKRHWGITDCKHITPDFVDDGWPLAGIREVQSKWIDLEDAKQTTEYFYQLLIEGGRCPMPGDLILSRNATVGEVAQVPTAGPEFALGQDVVLLKRHRPDLSPDYLQAGLHSDAIRYQLDQCMIGSTFKRINVEDLRSLTLAWPPAQEQADIADFLEQEVAMLDSLAVDMQRAADLLRELRAALISAAVTGQIDVRQLTERQLA